MKYSYKQYGSVFRPVIPVELQGAGISVPYEALIDSGADICMFDAGLAELLGIDLAAGERHVAGGVTGAREPYYLHAITLHVGGWPIKISAGFLPNMARLGYGIVGQQGFFETYVVKFDLAKREIELKARQ